MMQPLKHVGKEYKTFIAKMVVNCGSMEFSKANLLNCVTLTLFWVCHVFCPCWNFNSLMKFV